MNGIIPRSFFSSPFVGDGWSDEELMPFSSGNGLSITEDEKKVYVEAAVPGVDPKEIELTYDKGILWIKAETKEEENDKKRKVYSQSQRSFSYRVSVPGDIDLNVEPEATYRNGIMTVAFAKTPQAQPKKIQLKVSE